MGQGNHKRRGLKEEKQAARATLLPLLQAEEDRKYDFPSPSLGLVLTRGLSLRRSRHPIGLCAASTARLG